MIMDGNKRWADLHGASLKEGYQKGLNKLREIISVCLEQEIKYLTVYALSAENMKRVSVPIIFDIIIKQSIKINEEYSFDNNVRKKNYTCFVKKTYVFIWFSRPRSLN